MPKSPRFDTSLKSLKATAAPPALPSKAATVPGLRATSSTTSSRPSSTDFRTPGCDAHPNFPHLTPFPSPCVYIESEAKNFPRKMCRRWTSTAGPCVAASVSRKSVQSAPLAIDLAAANECCSGNGADPSPRMFFTLDQQLNKLAGLKHELEGKSDRSSSPLRDSGGGGAEEEGEAPSSSIDKLSPEVLLMRRARLQSEWNNEVLHRICLAVACSTFCSASSALTRDT